MSYFSTQNPGIGGLDELTTAEELVVQSIASLTGNSLKFLRVNAGETGVEYATIGGGGDVSKVGTPVNNQVGVWTGDGTLEGDAALTFDTATDILSVPIIAGGSATTSDLTLQTTTGVGATGADMHFLVGNNGATEAMTVLNSGNVGIGTTNPYAKLSINNGTNINLGIKYGQDDATAVMLNAYNDAVSANIPMELRASKFMFMNGNVGIGTTVPTAVLHLKAGTATANTAPIKLTAGTVNTTPEAGAIEFDGVDLFITI